MSLPVWQFAAFTVPLVLTPGATTAVVLRNSIAGGARAGVFTAAGANAASCCYGLLTAIGVAAALQRWPSVWTGLRWVGMAYLSYLGLRAIVSAFRPRAAAAAVDADPDRTVWHEIASGFLTNALNPSLTAFYLIIVPQFIPRELPFARSALTLTAIHVSLAFSWHVAWASAGGTLARLLARGRPRRALDLLTGVALLGLAAKVVF